MRKDEANFIKDEDFLLCPMAYKNPPPKNSKQDFGLTDFGLTGAFD